MEYLRTLQNVKRVRPAAVTVGKFDGLHRGHGLLTKQILAQREKGLLPTVVTFDTSPRLELGRDMSKNLITNDERRWILEQEGIECLVELPFNREVMHLLPEDFIQILVRNLHMRYLAVGTDFRFGYQGKGDVALLETVAAKHGFVLEVLEKMQEDRRDISSTYIREEIAEGNLAKANALLGYEYFLWGEVVHGNHLGSRLGIPTINLIPSPEKLLPAFGVYATRVEIGGRRYDGVTNVGRKPTVAEGGQAGVETHILHFRGDLYHKKVKIVFLDFLRKEKKFTSVEELQSQMEQDVKSVRMRRGH